MGGLCTLGGKNIRTSEATPVKSGDRQPEQQTLVVPQRQCLRLVVYLPVHFPLPPTRGTTTVQPTLYPTLLKPKPRSWRQRIIMSYSPSFGEGFFCEE